MRVVVKKFFNRPILSQRTSKLTLLHHRMQEQREFCHACRLFIRTQHGKRERERERTFIEQYHLWSAVKSCYRSNELKAWIIFFFSLQLSGNMLIAWCGSGSKFIFAFFKILILFLHFFYSLIESSKLFFIHSIPGKMNLTIKNNKN